MAALVDVKVVEPFLDLGIPGGDAIDCNDPYSFYGCVCSLFKNCIDTLVKVSFSQMVQMLGCRVKFFYLGFFSLLLRCSFLFTH